MISISIKFPYTHYLIWGQTTQPIKGVHLLGLTIKPDTKSKNDLRVGQN